MRILYLVPERALSDPNTMREATALEAAGHEVSVIGPQYRAPGKVGRIFRLMVEAPRVAENLQAEVILCRDLDTLFAGARAKYRTGAKLVYWPHDVYSHMIEPDVPRFIYLQTVHHERRLFMFADAIIASNPGIVDWLVHEQAPKDGIGIDDPITIVMPCRDPAPTWQPPQEPRTLLYAGTLHKNRFTKEMIRAMEFFDDAKLIVAAPRTNNLYEWVRDNAGPNVEFRGTVTPEDVGALTRLAGIVVTMLNPEDKCLRVGLANKVFDAMSVGRAAIGTKGTATGDLIVENQMGLAVDYDFDSYIEGVCRLLTYDLSVPGYNAWNACVSRFNWKTEAAKLVGVFECL